MRKTEEFMGFPAEGLRFLEDLKQNNNREWFQAHKGLYTEYVLGPTQDFVLALGEHLKSVSEGITYDSQASGRGSILRIYRDLRFSKDKRPYNTNMRLFFWEGSRKKMENPGFYFHLDSTGAVFYSGFYHFTSAFTKIYREAIHDNQFGKEIVSILDDFAELDGYEFGGDQFKRVPTGNEKDHPRAELLRHKGLWGKSPAIPRKTISTPLFY